MISIQKQFTLYEWELDGEKIMLKRFFDLKEKEGMTQDKINKTYVCWT